MSANPVNAWDILLLAATETTLGTTPTPASTAAYAALAIEAINCSLGAAEVGVIRPKQDRALGRGMQSGWVEGRVQPIEWSVDTSLKSRAAVDTAPHLLALLKAAGLKVTTNASTNVTITPSTTPIESGDFAGVSLTRFEGQGLACHLAETLRGCVTRAIRLEGGGSELLAKLSGVGIGKSTSSTTQAGVQGRIDSITLGTVGATSLTITAEESYRLGLGYYLCESEIIQVTACTPGGTSATIARGALGSTAATHTAQPLVPYRPPSPSFTGSPIAEAVSTVTLGGVSLRCRSWSVDITTGMDLLEPETGSKFSQGAKYTRYDVKARMQLVLSGDQVSLLGKATARPNVALALAQGSGTGGIVTFNAPYCEVMPFTVPDTASDIAVVDVELRIRDNGTSDAFSIVLT